MDSIDNDAINVLGIDEKIWREFRKMTETYTQDDLPRFLEEEAKARESSISEDASFEHKRRVAMRWFGYYRKQKDFDTALKIGHQYNKIAGMCIRSKRERDG